MNAPLHKAGTSLVDVLEIQRAAFNADMLPSATVRRERLDRLHEMVAANEAAIMEAINADFHRPTFRAGRAHG